MNRAKVWRRSKITGYNRTREIAPGHSDVSESASSSRWIYADLRKGKPYFAYVLLFFDSLIIHVNDTGIILTRSVVYSKL